MRYCYARYTHEFMELRDPLAFEQKIYVKQQAAWLLRQDLKKVRPNESIAIGTATDPYQPAERRYNVTRGILEELAQHRGLRLGIITKSDLILRDAELLRQICQHNSLHVSLTVTTINIDLARILEPRAPRPDLRLEAVRKLHLAGIPAGVNCAPLLPGITDAPADLSALVLAAKAANATSIFAGPLFLKPCAAAVFLPFLEKEFPHLVEIYRKRYANSAFLPPDYGKRINRLLAELREKHGMTPPSHPDSRFGERQAVQDSLFCADGEDRSATIGSAGRMSLAPKPFLLFLQQHNHMRHSRIVVVQPLRGLCLQADTFPGNSQQASDSVTNLCRMRPNPGCVENECRIQIGHGITRTGHSP
jgi:DNA repair photolyase